MNEFETFQKKFRSKLVYKMEEIARQRENFVENRTKMHQNDAYFHYFRFYPVLVTFAKGAPAGP